MFINPAKGSSDKSDSNRTDTPKQLASGGSEVRLCNNNNISKQQIPTQTLESRREAESSPEVRSWLKGQMETVSSAQLPHILPPPPE